MFELPTASCGFSPVFHIKGKGTFNISVRLTDIMASPGTQSSRVQTGIQYADEVLNGGLMPASATLIRGSPGAGKTIFGLHFLAAGVEAGETGLYINLGEPADYFRETAQGFGLNIEPVEFLDLSATEGEFQTDRTYDLFRSGEVEAPGLVDKIRDTVEAIDPDRVVVDPITELRYLTPDQHQFRTQIMALLDFLKSTGATILLTSQAAPSIPDDDLQFLVDAVIRLDIDDHRRTFRVSKFRGSSSRSGDHSVTITDEGMFVWPRLDPSRHHREGPIETLSSTVPELDSLLGGGIATGTITFLSGPTGVGKTTLGLHLITSAAEEGHQSVLYSFEEGSRTMLRRANAIGLPIEELIEEGTVEIKKIDPETVTIDEFTRQIRTDVETNDVEFVMIDGVTGYERAFEGSGGDHETQFLKIMRYLRNMNVTGIMTNEVHQITGEFQATEQRVSHLADDIIILRHIEYKSELHKVIGVLKRRTSDFENRLRRLQITEDGIVIGDPLVDLRGILTGTPTWKDDEE